MVFPFIPTSGRPLELSQATIKGLYPLDAGGGATVEGVLVRRLFSSLPRSFQPKERGHLGTDRRSDLSSVLSEAGFTIVSKRVSTWRQSLRFKIILAFQGQEVIVFSILASQGQKFPLGI